MSQSKEVRELRRRIDKIRDILEENNVWILCIVSKDCVFVYHKHNNEASYVKNLPSEEDISLLLNLTKKVAVLSKCSKTDKVKYTRLTIVDPVEYEYKTSASRLKIEDYKHLEPIGRRYIIYYSTSLNLKDSLEQILDSILEEVIE